MKQMVVIYNPKSGNGAAADNARKLQQYMIDHKVSDAAHIQLKEAHDDSAAYDHARTASQQKVDWVIVLGGDGTIRQAGGGITAGGGFSALGIIPLGSVNNFAKALEIPLDPDEALEMLVHGVLREVDIAHVNDTYMISSLTVGLLADVAIHVSFEDKRRYGGLAFFWSFIRAVSRAKKYPLYIAADDFEMDAKINIVLVTMTHSVGGIDFFNPEALPDDGLLHVYVLSDFSFRKIIMSIPALLKGDFMKIPDFQYFTTRKLSLKQVSQNKKLRTRIDGDPSEYLPLELNVIHKGLKVIVKGD